MYMLIHGGHTDRHIGIHCMLHTIVLAYPNKLVVHAACKPPTSKRRPGNINAISTLSYVHVGERGGENFP